MKLPTGPASADAMDAKAHWKGFILMHLGIRHRIPFPWIHRGMRLVRTHGRVFLFPAALEPLIMDRHRLFSHPAVASTATLEEAYALIETFDVQKFLPEYIETLNGYKIYRLAEVWHAVPETAVEVDLNIAEDRNRAGVLSALTREELETRVQQVAESRPVEFAGWLPIFEWSGNCGKHPQFAHINEPPEGYRFTCSRPATEPPSPPSLWKRTVGRFTRWIAGKWERLSLMMRPLNAILFGGPRVGSIARLRVVKAMAGLGWRLWQQGIKLGPILRFLQSRHFQSQLLQAKPKELVFLTSMPYTYGQNPWVVEIEDPTTLFYPMIQNGNTCNLTITDSPYYSIVKTMLESDSCKGILTHIESTARLIPTLFPSDIIRNKILYQPLGVKIPNRWQRHDDTADDPIDLLFINSWCQVPENFHLRGGLDVLEAFAILRKRYPQLRLTMRTNLPALGDHYHRIIESGWVRIVNRFLSSEEMADLHAGSHIYLLPAARVHIVSLLQAMSYGLAVIGSDGWGMEEYLKHEHNGLIVKGRYGKVSWADEKAGILREDYEPMYTSSPEVVQGLVDSISRLVEDRVFRRRLGRMARHDIVTKYNMVQWNEGLQRLFDKARGIESRPSSVPGQLIEEIEFSPGIEEPIPQEAILSR